MSPMKRRILSGALAALALSCAATAQEVPSGETAVDPEIYGDMADARFQDVEWVLLNSPGLMEKVVSDALRSNPGVVKSIIRDTLLRNPDIVIGSLQEYQRRQQAGAATQAQDDTLPAEFLERVLGSGDAPVRGNPDGTVTIVEFSDYNCTHCRRFESVLAGLIESNPELRVVHREWPILSPDSVEVARIALAARKQGVYEKLHKAFMDASGDLDKGRALAIAADLGLDAEKLEEDAGHPATLAHIRKTAGFAEEISLQGTPAIIIGDRLARGFVGAEKIQPILDRLQLH